MTSPPFRRPEGGIIDRSRTVHFRFDGREFSGHPGDTLASALIANGVHMVARSFKYHRPRGFLAAGSEDPAGLVQIGDDPAITVPNCRATEQEIHDGLVARPQNCWPGLKFDAGIINDWIAPVIPAGFYYKTFMGSAATGWPDWMTVEPFIRRTAGLGKAPTSTELELNEFTNRHCEVLVVGGGPAGLSAARAAAAGGGRVILVEETADFGGTLLSRDPDRLRIDGMAPADWVWNIRDELENSRDVSLLTRATAFGFYSDNFVGVWQRLSDHLPNSKRPGHQPRNRIWRIRARQVVLATGSLERPLVFHNNDRPGIMLAGSVRTFLHRYGVLAGSRPVVLTNNDTGWDAAFDMSEHGADIAAIVDLRNDIPPSLLGEAAHRGIPIHPGSLITDTLGRKRVSGIEIHKLVQNSEGCLTATGAANRIECDLVAVSGGWMPNIALFSQSRGRLRYSTDLEAYVPGQSWQRERSVGAAAGEFDLAACLASGAQGGSQAAAAAGVATPVTSTPKVDSNETVQDSLRVVSELPGPKARATRAFVDMQDDVTAKDLRLAVGEGYRSVEHAKRFTTMGMGTDQGKISNLNAFAILAAERGLSPLELGTTTYRQPYKPVPIGALAGQHVGALFAPRRTTPMHQWHRAQEPIFEIVGDWLRPRAFPLAGESFHETVQRESKAARTGIGILDASTLGKIDIRGPDAREFLNRVYTNAWSRLAPGRCRYGLMLNEDGMVMDDGVTACIADDHFHMTTTTGGAATVLSVLEDYLQTEWTDLKVYLTTVTEQWAVAAICGPKSPELAAELLTGIDTDPERFPFMSWQDARFRDASVRVFRISFSGETAYEINIPATSGDWMWNEIMAAGEKFGITPYGTEAMHLLRAEKGFIIVGQDTDGTVTPHDLRMDWVVKKSGDFIGKRSLLRPDTVRTDRPQLVGLATHDPALTLVEGCQIIESAREVAPPQPKIGHVTSSYFSPNLERSVALALVESGGERLGQTLYVSVPTGSPIPVTVTETDLLALKEKGELPLSPPDEAASGKDTP